MSRLCRLLPAIAALIVMVMAAALAAAPADQRPAAETEAAPADATAAPSKDATSAAEGAAAPQQPQTGTFTPGETLEKTAIELPKDLEAETPDMKKAAAELAGEEEEEEDEGPKIDPVEVIKRIIENMDDSAQRLEARKEVGEETQLVQKEVVGDIEKLIEYIKEQQQQQQQQQQQAIRTLTYLIQHGGNIYSLMGISPEANFNNYFQLFTNSGQSFKPLTDPDKLNRQPERIKIVTVSQGTTLTQALRNNKVPDARMNELAVLNGMQLTDQVPSGTMIKVIGK
jgi:hypothetical protein